MSTATPLKVTAYRSEVELDGDVLRVTAVGKMGQMALGTHEREIELGHVSALSFHPANMVKNGSLVLVDERGKTHIHFRRKSNEEMKALFEQVRARVPAEAVGASSKGVGLIHEDVDAWQERKLAEIEEKRGAPQ